MFRLCGQAVVNPSRRCNILDYLSLQQNCCENINPHISRLSFPSTLPSLSALRTTKQQHNVCLTDSAFCIVFVQPFSQRSPQNVIISDVLSQRHVGFNNAFLVTGGTNLCKRHNYNWLWQPFCGLCETLWGEMTSQRVLNIHYEELKYFRSEFKTQGLVTMLFTF